MSVRGLTNFDTYAPFCYTSKALINHVEYKMDVSNALELNKPAFVGWLQRAVRLPARL